MATQPSATYTALARLRLRQGAPRTDAAIVGYVEAGAAFQAIASVAGEPVNGNAIWLRLDSDRFVWSGATLQAAAATAGTAAMDVSYRSDVPGALAVLSDAERDRVFGPIVDPKPALPRGAVTLDPDWVKANLVEIDTPIFAALGHPRITVHRLAAKPFQAVFATLGARGLADRVLRFDGSFVPRHKGWDPDRSLSSHSWGIAIDLNARWNGYGSTPAALGAIGCVRELIPIFAGEGFAWGGYFTPDAIRDGMHFEFARRDPPTP